MKNVTKQSLFAALSAAAALCIFTSCASSPETKPANPAVTDAGALLDDSTKVGATDVPEANAFADLDATKNKAPGDDKKDDASAAAESADSSAASGDTYYSSMGGETLRRVAFTLYSNKTFFKKLLEKNPDLKGVKKLSADQKVFFDMDSAMPEPRFLTKDLLNRYAQPLSTRMQSEVKEKGLGETTVTLNKGESLQDLSQRLYGTHRYWTEIYLVNKEKIDNYDKVKAGLALSVVNHPNAGVAKAEAAPVMSPPPAAEDAPEAAPAPEPLKVVKAEPITNLPTQPVTVPIQKIEPVAPPSARDPIPEIPPVAGKAPPPPMPIAAEPLKPVEPPKPLPVAEAPKPRAPIDATPVDTVSANSSLRRILYVVLILVIGGAAFYFTRTPKRPKVDMLDLNAGAGPRPKLSEKDSQKSQLG